jgi:hypothetical protein
VQSTVTVAAAGRVSAALQVVEAAVDGAWALLFPAAGSGPPAGAPRTLGRASDPPGPDGPPQGSPTNGAQGSPTGPRSPARAAKDPCDLLLAQSLRVELDVPFVEVSLDALSDLSDDVAVASERSPRSAGRTPRAVEEGAAPGCGAARATTGSRARGPDPKPKADEARGSGRLRLATDPFRLRALWTHRSRAPRNSKRGAARSGWDVRCSCRRLRLLLHPPAGALPAANAAAADGANADGANADAENANAGNANAEAAAVAGAPRPPQELLVLSGLRVLHQPPVVRVGASLLKLALPPGLSRALHDRLRALADDGAVEAPARGGRARGAAAVAVRVAARLARVYEEIDPEDPMETLARALSWAVDRGGLRRWLAHFALDDLRLHAPLALAATASSEAAAASSEAAAPRTPAGGAPPAVRPPSSAPG